MSAVLVNAALPFGFPRLENVSPPASREGGMDRKRGLAKAGRAGDPQQAGEPTQGGTTGVPGM